MRRAAHQLGDIEAQARGAAVSSVQKMDEVQDEALQQLDRTTQQIAEFVLEHPSR